MSCFHYSGMKSIWTRFLKTSTSVPSLLSAPDFLSLPARDLIMFTNVCSVQEEQTYVSSVLWWASACLCRSEASKKKGMDLLLLPSRSNSDLRSQGRQLPQIPSGTGEDGEHTYSEVGRSSSTTRTDDALYAMVGRAGQTDTPAPPAVPANTPAPPDPDGDVEGGLPEPEAQVMAPPHPPETAEYACVRKLRKADKAPQKRDSGTDMVEPPVPPPRHAPPSHPAPPPPHPHSTKLPRRNVDAFNVPAFPKVGRETVVFI